MKIDTIGLGIAVVVIGFVLYLHPPFGDPLGFLAVSAIGGIMIFSGFMHLPSIGMLFLSVVFTIAFVAWRVKQLKG